MNVFNTPARRVSLLMTASLAILAGCEEGGGLGSLNGFADAAAQADPSGSSIDIIERDIEKPEIFSQRDMALWDGRPSFGGVWVALPGNVQPERVSIANVDNGKSVVGALFKREEQNPGPPIRLSSDAAAALEIVPGMPTLVAVTVVRRETFANVPNTPTDDVPGAVETAPLEPVPGAQAAAQNAPTAPQPERLTLVGRLAAALGGSDEAPAPAPQPETAPLAAASEAPSGTSASATATATAVAAAPTAVVAATPTPPVAQPKPTERRTILDLFRNRRETAAPQGEVISVITPDAGPQPVTTGSAPLEIQSANLPQLEAEAAAATAAAAQAAPAQPPAAAPASSLSKPFLQTGTFSERANAQKQVRALDAAGVPALIRSLEASSGKTLYRVVAGPAISRDQQQEFARIARSVGIKDAFPTTK